MQNYTLVTSHFSTSQTTFIYPTMKKLFNKLSAILYPLVSILAMLLVWHLIFLYVGSQEIFPSIGATLQSIANYLTDGNFWLTLLSTLGRVLLCFVLSLMMAIVMGVFGKIAPVVNKILSPVVALFRSAPTVAVMVILILFQDPKHPERTPIFVGLLVVFPMLYANVTSAISQVDNGLVEMCKLYNVPKAEQLKFVYLPAVVPYLLGELPATLSFTVKLIVSAEILCYTYQSIGGLIQSANVYSDMASLFALTLLSVAFATILDALLRLVAKRIKGGAR